MLTHICGFIVLIGIIISAAAIIIMKHNKKRPKILMTCFITVTVMAVITLVAFAVGLFTAPRPF